MNSKSLHQAALNAQTKSYSPYSEFRVGAAILDENGDIHSGCNIENAAYPIGCCAEQSAVAQMIINGGHVIKHILIIGKPGETCPPCGACRQIIAEHGDEHTLIHLEATNGQFKAHSIEELLPNAFNLSTLER